MKHIFLIVSLLLSRTAFADRYQDEIDRFFELYENGKTLEAVDPSIPPTNGYRPKAMPS